jgi:tetrahydromethanopterin S-methyltransferase subunit H
VEEGEDVYDVAGLPPNQRDSVAAKAAIEMKGSVGLPIGVQVRSVPAFDPS